MGNAGAAAPAPRESHARLARTMQRKLRTELKNGLIEWRETCYRRFCGKRRENQFKSMKNDYAERIYGKTVIALLVLAGF
jgi:hypothetical protein